MNDFRDEPLVARPRREGSKTRGFIYNGRSMSPLLRPGDMLCVIDLPINDVRLGDIVVFRHLEYSDSASIWVVHRVAAKIKPGLITQGDNNFRRDAQIVSRENFTGKVVLFERQGHYHAVRGGWLGIAHMYLIWIRNNFWMLFRRLGWGVYRKVRESRLVARLWQPRIIRIRFMTNGNPLVKYRWGDKTVACWWPAQERFSVVKPFDLVIPDPVRQKLQDP